MGKGATKKKPTKMSLAEFNGPEAAQNSMNLPTAPRDDDADNIDDIADIVAGAKEALHKRGPPATRPSGPLHSPV